MTDEVAKLKESLSQHTLLHTNRENITVPTAEEGIHSLQFLSKPYDNLHSFQESTKDDLKCLSARLALVESKVDVNSNAIDEIEDYSYQFNVKFNGVPETSTNESSRSTSSLCINLLNEMGAEVTILDIDTAHRVPSRSDRASAPKQSRHQPRIKGRKMKGAERSW